MIQILSVTRSKEYTIIPIVQGPSGNAGFLSSTVFITYRKIITTLDPNTAQ